MTIMKNLRLLMELTTDTMTTEVTDNTITILLAMLFDSMTDITHKRVRLSRLHTNLKTLLGNTNQLLLFWSCLAANDEHTAGICIVTIHDGSHIHIDDVTLFEDILFLRNTMTYHFIDGCTYALRVALIVEAGRNRIMILAILHTEVIDLLSIDTRTDHLGNSIETTCIHDTTLANAFYLFWSLNQVAGRHKLTLIFPKHHLLVELCNRLTRQTMPSFLLNHCLII